MSELSCFVCKLFVDDSVDSNKADEIDVVSTADRFSRERSASSPESGVAHCLAIPEFRLLQMAALQLGALKCLNVFLSSSKFTELLLVPKGDLGAKKVAANNGSKCEGDSEMREALRMILKQMVKRAVMPSPIKRSVQLIELERAQSMLQKVTAYLHADETIGVQSVRGRF